ASIRPRPLRRGDLPGERHAVHVHQASIRPRPLRRGDAIRATGESPGLRSFNSATASAPGRHREDLMESTNGPTLQFGHGLCAVETLRGLTDNWNPDQLQFGHGLCAVETWNTRGRFDPGDAALQFGHGLCAVETSATSSPGPTGPGFNSATASAPWRHH